MEIVIGLIGLCGMAVVALILWDRLGRLEFEIKRLKTIVGDGPAQIAQAAPVSSAATDAAPEPSAIPSSPALDPPEKRSELARPAAAAAVTEHASDDIPDAAMARTGAEDLSRPVDSDPEPAEIQPPAAAVKPPKPDRAARRRGFEQLFGARLAVWGGGIALAMAGFFLVKYSVEIGLITPPVRMVLGGLFGLVLLAAAEFVHRRPAIANGARIAQSLAGAGIAVLYAVIYITTSIHALVPTAIGFVGLAATTAAALALSLRRGPPIAVMGLIGGFATPALVSTGSPNVPILMLYLFLVIGGLMLLIRRQGWWWLAIPAALGGFGWIGLLLADGLAAENSLWIGLFLLAMTGMVFATSAEDRKIPLGQLFRGARSLMPILTGGVALAQLAIVVGASGFGWTDWGLFGLLAAACIILGARNDNCALLPPIALTVALTLLALWPGPDALRFIVMAAVFLVLFVGAGYWMAWRSGQPLLWLGQALAASAGLYGVSYITLHPQPIGFTSDAAWAALAIVLAIPAALAAAKSQSMRTALGPATDRMILAAGAVSAALVSVALLLAVPATQLPFSLALQTLVMVFVARRFDVDVLNWLTPPMGGAFAVALLAAPGAPFSHAVLSLLPDPSQAIGPLSIGIGQTIWVFALPTIVLALATQVSRWASHRLVFSWSAMALGTLAIAAVVPAAWLPLAMTLEALGLVLLGRRYARRDLIDQSVAAVALFGLQTLPVLAEILSATAPSLAGQPIDASQLPGLGEALRVLLLPAVPLAAVAWFYPADRWRAWQVALQGAVATALLLLGYLAIKALFGIELLKDFQQRGFFERAVLTQSLFALGAAAFWARNRFKRETLVWPGMILTGMAIARLVWFDLLVFNPMLAAQHVGDWPLLNGLLLAYGLPILWLVALQRVPLPAIRHHAVAAKSACLALILILALSQVRHLFHGGLVIAGAVGTAELYAYSAAALATAIGFLIWGAARGDQLTRLASLGLLLAAIAKVFLYDASELTGLWRIAAFAGLGVSLLGISWFYGRFVFGDRRDPSTPRTTAGATELSSELP